VVRETWRPDTQQHELTDRAMPRIRITVPPEVSKEHARAFALLHQLDPLGEGVESKACSAASCTSNVELVELLCPVSRNSATLIVPV
jgi:hypothetical protein